MTETRIQRMTPEDWARALADTPDAFGMTLAQEEAKSPADWRALLAREGAATFVAARDGADVGLVVAAPYTGEDGATGLFAMWVAPEARGKGLGDALVETVVRHAEADGADRVVLDVADGNAPAIRLYERHGFAPTGVTGTLPPPRERVREHQRVRGLRRDAGPVGPSAVPSAAVSGATGPTGLEISTPGDREIVFTRTFDAPRVRVFEALTRPDLVGRWLLGPPGWTMTVCEVDPRVGGTYRYEWRRADGAAMGMGGVHAEFAPPERLVASERFDDPWYPGEAVGTVVLTESAGRTTYVLTMRYESSAAREVVLGFPVADGMAASLGRLAEIVAAPRA